MEPTREYDLFVSYARIDNATGAINELVSLLKAEYHRVSGGEELNVFFDTHEIKDGNDWEQRIYAALSESKFLLPIITPSYFSDDPKRIWCRKEWERFIEIEQDSLNPGHAITPIYLIDDPRFTQDDVVQNSPWMQDLHRRQYVDIRKLWVDRDNKNNQKNLRERLGKLATSIHARVNTLRAAYAAPHNFDRWTMKFVGRIDVLRELRDQLIKSPLSAITAVNGLAGIGKSTLAVEYAHRSRDLYPGGRIKVDCENLTNAESLGMELVRLAESWLGLRITKEQRGTPKQAIPKMKAHVQERPRSLWILDNVTTPSILDARTRGDILPSLENVHILITTKESGDRLGGIHAIPLDELSDTDGQELLFRFRPLEIDVPNENEMRSSVEIVRSVGGHALALEITGVYLSQHRSITYSSFLDGIKKRGIGHKLDSAGNAIRDTGSIKHPERFIGPLLQPTLDDLDDLARRALEYAAWLPSSTVCLQWLRDLVEQDFPGRLDHELDEPDPWLEGVCRKLSGLRLMVPNRSSIDARVHRLVQQVLRAAPGSTDNYWPKIREYAKSRVEWFKTNWQHPENQWEIIVLIQVATQWTEERFTDISLFANSVAQRCLDLGLFIEARQTQIDIIELDKRIYKADDRIFANHYNTLGWAEYKLGNLKEARRHLLYATQINGNCDSSDILAQAEIDSNLSSVEQSLSNHHEARRLALSAIKTQEKFYKHDALILANSYSNLATVEHYLGNLSEARRLINLVLNIDKKHKGPHHYDFVINYSNLASIEKDFKNYKASRRHLRHALEINKKIHKAGHITFASIYSDMGVTEQSLGNIRAARRLMRDAIEIEEMFYASDHPSLANRYWNLATIEASLNNMSKAIQLMQKAYRIRVIRFGHEHEHTKKVQQWLIRNDRKLRQ